MPDSVTALFEMYKTLAVVGLSSKPARPSYGVSAYMLAHGFRIIPVNPHEASVLGQKAYGSLDEVPGPLEIVVVFRRSERVPEVIESAIRKGAKVVWMQEGVSNDEAAAHARAAGLTVIQDRCILKEHAKRFVTEGI